MATGKNKDTIQDLLRLAGTVKFYELNSLDLAFYVGQLKGIANIDRRELDILVPRLEKCYKAGAYDLISPIAKEIAERSEDLDLASRLYVEYELRFNAVYAATNGVLPTESREKEQVGA